MEQVAQVFVTHVQVKCPYCKQTFKLFGTNLHFTASLSEEWDALCNQRHVTCRSCSRLVLWPKTNPFKQVAGEKVKEDKVS
jgi:phage FluMu protein Com